MSSRYITKVMLKRIVIMERSVYIYLVSAIRTVHCSMLAHTTATEQKDGVVIYMGTHIN
jgi:hypothetical protein